MELLRLHHIISVYFLGVYPHRFHKCGVCILILRRKRQQSCTSRVFAGDGERDCSCGGRTKTQQVGASAGTRLHADGWPQLKMVRAGTNHTPVTGHSRDVLQIGDACSVAIKAGSSSLLKLLDTQHTDHCEIRFFTAFSITHTPSDVGSLVHCAGHIHPSLHDKEESEPEPSRHVIVADNFRLVSSTSGSQR